MRYNDIGDKMNYLYINSYPKIDLHGCDRESARVMTNDFVLENVMLGNKNIVIVHGKGLGIVKNAVHEALKINKMVVSYKVDNFNDGCTIVELKIK